MGIFNLSRSSLYWRNLEQNMQQTKEKDTKIFERDYRNKGEGERSGTREKVLRKKEIVTYNRCVWKSR